MQMMSARITATPDPTTEKGLTEELHALREDTTLQSKLKDISKRIVEAAPKFTGTAHDREQLLLAYVRACGVLHVDEVFTWMHQAYFAIQGRTWRPVNPILEL